IVAHVGDVDLEREVAVWQLVDEDGVIEVARGFAIYGDDGQIAKIAPALQLGARDESRNGLSLIDDFRWKAVRQMMLSDYDFDIDAEIVRRAENFDYASDRGDMPVAIVEQFSVDDHTVQIAGVGDFDWCRPDAIHLGGGWWSR